MKVAGVPARRWTPDLQMAGTVRVVMTHDAASFAWWIWLLFQATTLNGQQLHDDLLPELSWDCTATPGGLVW